VGLRVDFDVDRSIAETSSPTGSYTRRNVWVNTPANIRSSTTPDQEVAVSECSAVYSDGSN
jgi:hypothetical protein